MFTRVCTFFFLLAATVSVIHGAEKKSDGDFVPHRVGNYRSEACGVGDFNNDGKLDIVAGPFLYLAPDWKAVKIRELKGSVNEQGDGYMWDFANLPLDIDGDGRLDVFTCSWHEKQSSWFRNPGPAGGLWRETIIEVNGNFETADLWDLDADGEEDEILPAVQGTCWYERGTLEGGRRGMVKHVVSEKTMAWGVGAGDVNGDGRVDILRPDAWFEAPSDRLSGAWKERPLALGNLKEDKPEHTPQILVADVNGDGRGDIITSSAHRYGIFWYEQKGTAANPTWTEHVIDDSWSQAHALRLADLDGDGDLDLVTGKRARAHNGHDPVGSDPPGVYWYEFTPKKAPFWKKHTISYNEGIGAGLNIPVVDLDGDGDLDIVVTGKWGGPVWFENTRK